MLTKNKKISELSPSTAGDTAKVLIIPVCKVRRAKEVLPEIPFATCVMDNLDQRDIDDPAPPFQLVSFSRDSSNVVAAKSFFEIAFAAYVIGWAITNSGRK